MGIAYRFEELRVGKDILELISEVYSIARVFPEEEKFALTSQMKRAVTSVYLNIAEGSGKKTAKDCARFVSQSMGSLLEVKAVLNIGRKLGFLDEKITLDVDGHIEVIWKQLCKLRDTLQS